MKRLIACLLSLALLTASLHAFGEETGFTVHLDPQGGRVQEELLHTGETGTLTFLPQPVRTGYHFAGWFTQSDAQVFCNTTVFAGETTLYAKWEEGQPCITHRFDFETRDLSEDGWTLGTGTGTATAGGCATPWMNRGAGSWRGRSPSAPTPITTS